MMSRVALMTAVMAWASCAGPQAVPTPAPPATAPAAAAADPARSEMSVADTLVAIQRAAAKKDYATTSSYVDAATLKRYERLLLVAQHGSESQVRATPLLERILIVRMRHELGEALDSATAVHVLARGIDIPFIGFEAMTWAEPGPVDQDGAHATVTLVWNGAATSRSYAFSREDGTWRLDLWSVYEDGERVLREQLRRSGKTEDEFIADIVETASGHPVGQTVWASRGDSSPAPPAR